MHHVDFVREDVDIAVRHGDGRWPGLECYRFCTEHLFAVCGPKLVSAPRLKGPGDVVKLPLLHLDDRKAWSKLARMRPVRRSELIHGPILNRASMLIDAAVDGQGVALARTTLAAWDLMQGCLVRPFAIALPLSKTDWIVSPKATAGLPKIMMFRDWLLAEAADDVRRIAAIDQGQPAA